MKQGGEIIMNTSWINTVYPLGVVIALAGILLAASGCSVTSSLTSGNATTVISSTSTGATVTESTSATTTTATSVGAAVQLISPQDARSMLESNDQVLLLDVRTAEEYADGHIPGSVLMPYDSVEARAGELPEDLGTPIIIYCRSGRRSAIAAEVLADLGYTRIYDLGGIQDWPYEVTTD